MIRFAAIMLIAIMICPLATYGYESLNDVFVNAGGNGEYDKYIELDPATEYLGDLFIDNGHNVRINGNGAIIHGENGIRAIHVYASRLDITNCIIVGGLNGIHFDTLSYGNIYNNTVIDCDSIGIVVFNHDYYEGVEVWDNIVVGGIYGFIHFDLWQPNYLGYNTIYGTSGCRYGEFCPD